MKSKVYFSRTITPEQVTALYDRVGKPLTGKVAIKVHSGRGGQSEFPAAGILAAGDRSCGRHGDGVQHGL